MQLFNIFSIATLALVTGCSSSGGIARTKTASHHVESTVLAKIEIVNIASIHDSFKNPSNPSIYIDRVIETSGEVTAFSMNDESQYTITITEDGSEAICVFDNSISEKLGSDRLIHHGVKLTIQGKCYSSGLFAKNPFTLDGCRIVNK